MANKCFRLGQWHVDPTTNVIVCGEQVRQLEPRAMDVLLFLCKQSGAVVSIEELLMACWGSHLQNDNVLHKIITQLRRAFDDSSTQPRYIETIRKRGYRIVAELVYDVEVASSSWLESSPFRGLHAFEEHHAGIFFGRQLAITQLAQIALDQARAACAMVLVLGPSGSGKTSLVRAGLVPHMMKSAGARNAQVTIDCSLYFDCADLGEGDLFDVLASVLLDSEIDGKLLFEKESATSLGRRLANNLDAVIAELVSACPRIALLLFIDRFEALFRLPHIDEPARVAFIAALDRLARSGCVMVVLACRNDFYPNLVNYSTFVDLIQRGGHFNLLPPSAAELAQIIREPARVAQLQFTTDVASGERLDDAIFNAANASPESLPLLQYCFQELYRQKTASGELLYSVFQDLGGLEGALGARAEQVVSSLKLEQLNALPRILAQLVLVSEDGPSVTARRVSWSALSKESERELVRALVEARLFTSDLAGGAPAFGITHEALLRRWPRVVAWIEEHRQGLQIKARIGTQARRWHDSGLPADLLLPNSSQANQAKQLLDRYDLIFSENESAFIHASVKRLKRNQRRRMMVMGVVICLALLAVSFGIVARSAQLRAEKLQIEAEGLVGFMLGEFVDKLRPLGRLELLDSVSNRALAYLSGTSVGDADGTALAQRAKALQVISEVKVSRADPTGAAIALKTARDILQKQLQRAPTDTALLKSAGENAFWLGRIHLDQKDWQNAEHFFNDYRDFSDRFVAADPTDVDGWIEQSYAHNNLGTLALKRSNLPLAATEFAQSVALKSSALARKQSNNLSADLADSLSWLASTRVQQGMLEAAIPLYEQEFSLFKSLHSSDPDNAQWTQRLALSRSQQAYLKTANGDVSAALDYLASGDADLQALVLQDPSNREWQRNLLSVRLQIFDLQSEILDSKTALTKLKVMHAGMVMLSNLEPKRVILQVLVAGIERRMAFVYQRSMEPNLADKHLATAHEKLAMAGKVASAEKLVRDEIVKLLLTDAEILAARKSMGPSREQCARVIAILQPWVTRSTDFHLLAPWVRAHICLGQRAKAETAERQLAAMQYRDPDYMRFLSTNSTERENK